MNYTTIVNNQTIRVAEIPEVSYYEFLGLNVDFLTGVPDRHCVNYFGYRVGNQIKLICCIADDQTHQIYLSSCLAKSSDTLDSFTAKNSNFEKFEREICENFGLNYTDHPWLKPVRYAHNRADQTKTITNYPFYAIESDELHEVGVGPFMPGLLSQGIFVSFVTANKFCISKSSWAISTAELSSNFLKRKSCFSAQRLPKPLLATRLSDT